MKFEEKIKDIFPDAEITQEESSFFSKSIKISIWRMQREFLKYKILQEN